MGNDQTDSIRLFLLGQARVFCNETKASRELLIQPKPMHLLAFLGLNWRRPHRREVLWTLFWPKKPARSAANNLRQALWRLRNTLPAGTLTVRGETASWNSADPPWVDVLAFAAAAESGDLDTALSLYQGAFLPDCYAEWAQLEQERLRLVYLSTLERRAHEHFRSRRWAQAQSDAQALEAADPLNEAAVRLLMSSFWAQDRREAARRCYDSFRQRVQRDLGVDPLPETTQMYQSFLRGRPHPARMAAPTDELVMAKTSHLMLLETLGAFRKGLEQAQALADEEPSALRAAGLRWQGRFYLRMGKLAEARQLFESALACGKVGRPEVLADLAAVTTGLGDYPAAQEYLASVLDTAVKPKVRMGLLSSMGGLKGRMGQVSEAALILEQAVSLARQLDDPAGLAVASGNLGIMLIGRGEQEAAETALREALGAAQRADAHWLTAHITGHLGVLAQDRRELEIAAQHYQSARTLAETIGDQRCATLWMLNMGIVCYEQGCCDDALPLLTQGREQALAQGSRALAAGASIFIGSCLAATGRGDEGLARIDEGLAAAQEIGDQERILMGLLHRGRALAALGQISEAIQVLQTGLKEIESSKMHRMESLFHAELEKLTVS